jgi:protoporphyrinogen oxidase
MKRCVVVGAGPVGILAAFLYKQKYDEVVLVEKGNNLGGLLSSFDIDGAKYDFGTHIPGCTGNEIIDNFFYGDVEKRDKNYYKFHCLKSENYFENKWYETNTLIDVRNLNEKDYFKGVIQLLEAPGLSGNEKNLEEFLENTVGSIFTEKAYVPVFSKLQGSDVSLKDISPEVLRLFGLQRVIALNESISKELKKIPRLDQSLGYHRYDDGERNSFYYYPKGNNGIGKWMDDAVSKLYESGVKIVTGQSVATMSHNDGNIDSIILTNGEEFDINYIAWTVPTFLAFKAANINFVSKSPEFRNHLLCHYEIDKKILKKEAQYLLCWDPNYASYRITLYPNITCDSEKSSRNNLTVEVISDDLSDDLLESMSDKIFNELKQLGVIPEEAKILHSKTQNLGAGFPVFTNDFVEDVKEQARFLSHKLDNFSLLGRSSGKGFFINDLLLNTYNEIVDD